MPSAHIFVALLRPDISIIFILVFTGFYRFLQVFTGFYRFLQRYYVNVIRDIMIMIQYLYAIYTMMLYNDTVVLC